MVMTVHCDVVSAEESIFSGLVEIAVFPAFCPAIRRC